VTLQGAARHVQGRKQGPSCGFGKILASLTPDDIEFFDNMTEDGKTYSYISEVFNRDGHDTNPYTVGRHMRGDCKCR